MIVPVKTIQVMRIPLPRPPRLQLQTSRHSIFLHQPDQKRNGAPKRNNQLLVTELEGRQLALNRNFHIVIMIYIFFVLGNRETLLQFLCT